MSAFGAYLLGALLVGAGLAFGAGRLVVLSHGGVTALDVALAKAMNAIAG